MPFTDFNLFPLADFEDMLVLRQLGPQLLLRTTVLYYTTAQYSNHLSHPDNVITFIKNAFFLEIFFATLKTFWRWCKELHQKFSANSVKPRRLYSRDSTPNFWPQWAAVSATDVMQCVGVRPRACEHSTGRYCDHVVAYAITIGIAQLLWRHTFQRESKVDLP